ncbi:hypothetical protein TRIATDRAFT_49779 [Trichoderma atroviride IMI 206040]|uniref:Carboxypeptidase S1 n=1 Tax=Hypocrea atroviridis (strain ATCC 20476 / IMI 206040) TaxID=452589 RepID=G9NKB5_HYPAI|nr:uncharacterized protein TRIATDRAFT_49779 [Trichoderma atroviride IMI 206040]EHK49333.1 hypothetical protein TRIATDRAFT_49779 [Trichoderma atroviride IMI 206040]
MKPSKIVSSVGISGLGHALAQSTFIPSPSGLEHVLSQRWPGASIDYKQTSICEVTPGVKAWSGYVSLPASVQNQVEHTHASFDVNLFFWYFESRHDAANAPTAIYLGGGPGYTSLDSMSGFPCNINNDSNSTTLNTFSWNNNVNMLYIDQPVGTSFSYATIQDGFLNVANPGPPVFTPLQNNSQLKTNATFMAATLDPRPLETTQNTTAQAARTIWQFAQIWFQEFPKYNTTNKEISIWGTSYGGFWSTAFMSHFITQNKLIAANQHKNENATVLPTGILGIANGCIDTRAEAFGYPHLAYNNTYGIQVYNESVYNEVMQQVVAPKTGCYDAVDACRTLANEGDPYGYGNNETVNQACLLATEACFEKVVAPYMEVSNISSFDITYLNIASDAADYFNGFFNQRWVQEDLAVRVNFTGNDYSYQTALLAQTGNAMVQDISLLEHVLNNGVGVALVFGDRDYKCNWIGAENISLSMDYSAAASFRQAGYTDIQTNSSYKGGLVRQHGNVSFSRVFDAGHAVAAYQPQTVYEIFERSMFRKDIATGAQDVNDCFSTKGPLSSWAIKNSVPLDSPENVCYTYVAADTCTDEQLGALANGTAVIVDFVVTTPAGKRLRNSSGEQGANTTVAGCPS